MSSKDLPEHIPSGSALDSLKWNSDGLIPVTTVEHETGTVLMAANVNREALEKSLEEGYAVYWSRSRGKLWLKGEESGHKQKLHEVRSDCDGDHILYVVEAAGPACHTMRKSCFSWRIDKDDSITCDREPEK